MAQLTDRHIPRRLTAELLFAAARDEDLSGWPAEDAAVARAALSKMARAIDDAQTEIDAYLSSRYTVPLPTPPAVLMRFTSDIARYGLYEDNAKDEVRQRYEDAIAFLKAIAAGKASLGPGEGDAPLPTGGGVEMVTAGKVFGRRERGL
jgi:phage gp36-like protein